MQCEGLQRYQGVESRRAGDVDEGEADDDGADEGQGMHGEFERRVDLLRWSADGSPNRSAWGAHVCEEA